MSKNYKPWIYDIETYENFFCCTFLNLFTDDFKVFIIDENKNESRDLKDFIESGLFLIGYNSKSYDNLMINYITSNLDLTPQQIFKFSDGVINDQRILEHSDYYKRYGNYMHNDSYKYIDLMRMLFSKKLRVSLKELECSLNFKNVEELPYPIGVTLDEEQKQKVILYNYNDCEATREVCRKSLPDIKLRKWTLDNFGVEGYSLDGVNLGVKILAEKLAERVGNKDFLKLKTNRTKVDIKDIIYPFIKFETPEFKAVLKRFQKLKCYKYFNKEKQKLTWNKIDYQPLIGPYRFKYGIGGLHFETLTKGWHSNDEYDLLSIDVSSYYPRQVVEYPEYCKPEHLPDEFIISYKEVMDERLKAKEAGDDIKSDTYKLSINGAFGNLSNEYSWLCDQKALMAITVNGQLMLSMLCERLMLKDIKLVDVNTDGIYVHLKKSQRDEFNEICEKWSKETKMILEETKFESLYFITTGDYFGTTYKKGKLIRKEKGCFITEPRLGKGMEFPVIYKAIKEHFLNGVDFTKYIRECKEIFDFCSYKKLTKKDDATCFWKGEKQQLVNRYYASRKGAHLYNRTRNSKKEQYSMKHILKDSPVMLYNKADTKSIEEREINYPFYLSKTRELIVALEGDKNQKTLW